MEDDLNQRKQNLFGKLVEDYQLTPALPELGTAQLQLVYTYFLYKAFHCDKAHELNNAFSPPAFDRSDDGDNRLLD